MNIEGLYKKWWKEAADLREQSHLDSNWLVIYNDLVACGNTLQRPGEDPLYQPSNLPTLWREDATDIESNTEDLLASLNLTEEQKQDIRTGRRVHAKVLRKCADELEAIL